MTEGVYIGEDIEIVAAGAYVITYRRSRPGNFLESLLYRDGACVGVCRTSPALTARGAEPDVWRWAFVFHGEVRATDDEMRAKIGVRHAIAATDGGVRAEFGDGILCEAALDERIEKAPPAPAVSAETVGECWRLWTMGVREEIFPVEGRETFIGVTIDTARHMYIFEMTPGSVYCRAARYVSTNRGVVFNQNFRQGGEAYMIPDNRAARETLPWDAARFRADACFWDDRSVYWSLISFAEDEIVLNGCNGGIYRLKKPSAV